MPFSAVRRRSGHSPPAGLRGSQAHGSPWRRPRAADRSIAYLLANHCGRDRSGWKTAPPEELATHVEASEFW